MSVLEGAPFETLKDVLSLPRKYKVASINNNQDVNSYCLSEIELMKNSLSQCQADLNKLKEERHSSFKKVSEDPCALKQDVASMKKDTYEKLDKLSLDIKVNSKGVSRIEDARFASVSGLKSIMTSLADEVKVNKDH